MKLDEQLADIEKRQEKELEQKQKEACVKAQLEKEQENQKSVEEYEREIREGKVHFYDQEYTCQSVRFLQEEITMPVFDDRKVAIRNEQTIAFLNDDDFNTSINLYVSEQTMSALTPELYKKGVKEQFQQNQITFQANGEGVFESGGKEAIYVTGIVSVAVGYIYQIIFCVPMNQNNSVLVGSFSCLLKDRFVFEHFFFAVLKQFFDEGGTNEGKCCIL